MVETQETSYNTTTSNNRGWNTARALELRLDTKEILERIEMYLKGEMVVVYADEDGNRYEKRESTGNCKANEKGQHALLNYVSSIINPQVVQGNFPSDREGRSQMYDAYIQEVNIDLLDMIMTKLYDWEIEEDDVNELCDFVMKIVAPFISRLIDNKERDSYTDTLKHFENQTVKEGGRGLQLVAGN